MVALATAILFYPLGSTGGLTEWGRAGYSGCTGLGLELKGREASTETRVTCVERVSEALMWTEWAWRAWGRGDRAVRTQPWGARLGTIRREEEVSRTDHTHHTCTHTQ